MSRYINADRAIESLFDYCNGKKTIGQCIDDTPTEDVKPIEYGEWKHIVKGFMDFGEIRCSKCDWKNDFIKKFNFCPNCGATMRKEQNNE